MALTAGISPAAQTAPEDAQLNEVQAALKRGNGTKLVILGSGAGPNPRVPNRSRYMTSHIMLSNDRPYVLDGWLGGTNQFARPGTPFPPSPSISIPLPH